MGWQVQVCVPLRRAMRRLISLGAASGDGKRTMEGDNVSLYGAKE